MGIFGERSLRDQLLEIDWEKHTGIWNRRVRQYGTSKALTVLLVFVAGIYFIRQHDKAADLSWYKIKKNDKLYADEYFVTDTSDAVFRFNRLIRPITEADVKKMKLSVDKKRKIIAQLDKNNKSNLMLDMSEIVITKENLFKNGSAFIGTFAEKDSLTMLVGSGTNVKWYGLIPNERVVDRGYEITIPKGYVLANDYYYVEAADVRLEESEAIKKTKHITFDTTTLLKTEKLLNLKQL
ncbi:hypothetical protein [Mucilaginibacter glaciei]|uniref:Uncharacterized protein n=1 Tax=Mucilaginibacter glaciei TaxID=2772109 RepID=A0A926NZ60_9SPHI|nr:hypothetical protein [Mucilaginibacter glaciei]MBD1394603.1 hypothetical protein [Mucilaginibacter glaciei]